MSKKIAILGLGWLGLPLAKHLFKKGFEITGSTTSSEKLMQLLQSQLAVRIIKITKNNIQGNWKNFIQDIDTLIINIPPGKKDNLADNYALQMQEIVDRCDSDLKVIFVSSTSVYGNNNQIATEDSATNPTKVSGQFVLDAEKVIQTHFGKNATIVRFAGLFGPDRHPGRFLKANTPLPNPNGKINLIHLEDCITLIAAIIEKDAYGDVFNGSSDEHPTRAAFYTDAAFALSMETPDFDATVPAVDKTVSNEKSKLALGMVYKYANPAAFFDD
ncbi:MAG: NAD-dependent epimerase/dehydratase family protein [Crocinitomix sp.]|nr:NAD-dependent epimerase/dehydratase family protein [Crocinitomix sp.]